MSKKNKFTYACIILCILIIIGFAYYLSTPKNKIVKSHEKSSKVKLVIDAENKNILPAKFRTTNNTIKLNEKKEVNLLGLSDLNASGSGAFSKNELVEIKNNIGNKPIIDVDLRQESHGFVNGIGISYYGKKDDANLNLTSDEVISDENNKLNTIAKNKKVTFDKLSKKKSVSDISVINDVKTVQTEKELANSLGLQYLRITVPDHKIPTNDQVDSFVNFIETLPKGTWLHFHCRGGKGRTTTFLSMYDMLLNAKKVTFNDIMKRQKLIGGEDLLSGSDAGGKADAEKRSKLLTYFYTYCHDNTDNFKTTFSQWLQRYTSN